MGSYASTLNDSGSDIYIKYGPRDILGPILDFLNKLIQKLLPVFPGDIVAAIEAAILKAAKDNGLSKIGNGGHYDTDKLTLSLIIQANFIKTWHDSEFFYTQSGTIDEVTGPTDGSTNHYKLSTDAQWGEVKKIPIKKPASLEATTSSVTDANTLIDNAIAEAIEYASERRQQAVAAAA